MAQTKTAKCADPSSRLSEPGETVTQRAAAALLGSGYVVLKRVSCEFHEGVLVLRGQVPSYYLKQVAQTVVQTIADVMQVDNRLEVKRSDPDR